MVDEKIERYRQLCADIRALYALHVCLVILHMESRSALLTSMELSQQLYRRASSLFSVPKV